MKKQKFLLATALCICCWTMSNAQMMNVNNIGTFQDKVAFLKKMDGKTLLKEKTKVLPKKKLNSKMVNPTTQAIRPELIKPKAVVKTKQ